MKNVDDRIIEFIDWFHRDHGYPPTIREIGKGVGLSSTSSVSERLARLASEGRLVVSPGVARGLRVIR